MRRSPVGTDLLEWWRDEETTSSPSSARNVTVPVLSNACPSPRLGMAAIGIGCTRRIDRPCRDPKTCSQDPADGRADNLWNRTGPAPGACSGFTDCWTAYGIDVAFTPDHRHRAVHIQAPSGRCMLWVDGVRVAEGLALEHSGYRVGERFYVVQAAGPENHPEQGPAMGDLGWNILSLVVHDVERATRRRCLCPRPRRRGPIPCCGRTVEPCASTRITRRAGTLRRTGCFPVEPLPPV
ncbi:hypothetical protein GCM10010448_12250 [Streptomyces glomeratus]|uniref:PA14 domain-containing protein n=1 Tax=Streptomyces glomeratus TaxID=284452 RepID=A0ABP6L824_9ACTN